MKIVVDHQIVRILAHNPTEIAKHLKLSNQDNQIHFGWPSLLEYLELGDVLSNLPIFDQTSPLFKACIATLCANEEKEVLFYVYDRLFTENLNQVRVLSQMNSNLAFSRRICGLQAFLESFP